MNKPTYEELEAQCAAMSKTLKEALKELYSYREPYYLDAPMPGPVERKIEAVLQRNDAGKALLERIAKLEAVAKVTKRERDLEIERMEVIRKLANHEITKEFWLQDTIRYEKEHEKAEAELNEALAELEDVEGDRS